MTDLEIKYPGGIDSLPYTTTISVNVGDTINALRSAILNLEEVLGLNVNIGLFTPDPNDATVADRLNRIERGIAERNLVFREINVSDSLQVLLNQNNQAFVRIGQGSPSQIAPVTIVGPLTVLAAAVSNPQTVFQTPIVVDVTTLSSDASAFSLIKGKSNTLQPLLTISDTNPNPSSESYALKIAGNMIITGKLTADFSIDHNKILNIETVPTNATRGSTRHVTQGDYHTHRKGRYDSTKGTWIVDSSASTNDFGTISHFDLQGWGTLPTHDNSFEPTPGTQYHVTGGDIHAHRVGDGAQIDHNDLKNTDPKSSDHVTGGDIHAHTSAGDGGQISHTDLSDIETTGTGAIHVTKGDAHSHSLDDTGTPVGDGAQIDHSHLKNISTTGIGAIHVTGGDAHVHGTAGDGGQIDHTTLSNIGQLSHAEIDSKIATFRAINTGTASFTATGGGFSEVTVQHTLGTDAFNVTFALTSTPPSNPFDVGLIYVDGTTKTSSTFTLRRLFSSSSLIRTYDSGDVAANTLGSTIPHALGTVPTSLEIMHEINTKFEFLDASSYITSDATNIYTTNLSLLGTDIVRIIASVTTTSTNSQPGPAVKAQGQTSIGTNSDLLFVAKNPGSAGNNISIEYELNASITGSTLVVATLTSILVFFKTTAVTANDIRLAVLSDFTARSIVDVVNVGNGTGTVVNVPQFFLSGGADTSGISDIDLEWIAVRRN